jgi:hypothetical protein
MNQPRLLLRAKVEAGDLPGSHLLIPAPSLALDDEPHSAGWHLVHGKNN